jgi:hypothetical protein
MPTLFKKREDKHSVDGGSPDSQQTDVEASKGTPPEKAAFFMKSLPSKRDLTEQLHVTANVLDVARKETYQKKFRLWSKYRVNNFTIHRPFLAFTGTIETCARFNFCPPSRFLEASIRHIPSPLLPS